MNTQPGTIVVGVDASAQSLRALAWAVKQSVAEHRILTLVHALHVVPQSFMDAAIVYQQDAETRLRAEGQQVLDDAAAEVARIASGVKVEQVLSISDPRALLLELSRDAAMVVLGSRGRGQLRTLLLGSVGTALVRHAHCPVVVHRPGNPGTVRNGILVGVDASPESQTVLDFAYREASFHDLPLTLLHCGWDPHADALGSYLVAESIVDPESERLALAEAIAGMAEKYPEVRTTTEIVRGLPQEALLRAGERMNMIVVGAHVPGHTSHRLFGSVATSVVEHATCAVAVVPCA
jgi:nucleotide-binding universal stress UspA family protein